MKNIHLCTSWLKWCYLYLKLFLNSHLPEEYTPLCECFSIISMEEYLPPCKLTIMVFLHLKLFLPQEYIPLCECFSIFHWRISIFVWVENIIYLKNIHLCTSVFHFFLLMNTFVWVDSNGIAFTWIGFLPEEYTPLYKSTNIVFSTLEKKIIQRIYTSVWVNKNDIFYT